MSGVGRLAVGPPDLGESQPHLIQIAVPRRYSCSRLMSPDHTHPTDAFDTAELELPAPAEPPAAEREPGRPSWEPEEGDFS
jgi:hypothetical protein